VCPTGSLLFLAIEIGLLDLLPSDALKINKIKLIVHHPANSRHFI
jgi:hypothetical protein